MITALRKEYYWPGMKKDVVEYLARCLECQQIKVEHQHPAGLLQPLPIPKWKWETISMDFIMGLPKTRKNNDSIMVVVDKLSKSPHFIPMKLTYRAMQIAHIFMQNIFRLHGLPKTIISDCHVKFTSIFWKTLFGELGTQLNFSTAFHLKTNGQTKRVNQVVEDMLRSYVMQQPNKWEDYLHLFDFAYNNGYHTSLQMGPFEVKPEGEIFVEPLNILNRREVMLWKRAITQVKVQWQHFGPDEATWEDEELIKMAYLGLFVAERHRDDV
eukprot:PITA_32883